MSLPITIRCECGVESAATLGERVVCPCGREYQPSALPAGEGTAVRVLQTRMRFYMRIGALVVLGSAILGYLIAGWAGVALAAPAAAVVWIRLIQPRFKQRVEEQLRALPAWQLQAEPRSDAAP